MEASDEWAFDVQVRCLGSASVLSAFGVDAVCKHCECWGTSKEDVAACGELDYEL